MHPDSRPLEGQRAVVIGGAGAVGEGVTEAFVKGGAQVAVVDPDGPALLELGARVSVTAFPEDVAGPDLGTRLLDECGSADMVVLSLSARGEGRALEDLDAADFAARSLSGRLQALQLAMDVLGPEGGVLIELTGGAILATEADPAEDEARLIAAWQRGLHHVLGARDNLSAALVAISTPVRTRNLTGEDQTWPQAVDIGSRLVELVAGGGVGGLYRIAAPDFRPVRVS